MRLGRCLWVALIVAAFVGCDDSNDVRHLDAWVDTPLADADVDAAPVDAANVTVAASASTGGTVLVSEETGGSCSGTSCTLATGASKVTFTPVADADYRFDSWTGSSCVGYTASAGDAITFDNPIADHACTATFIATVNVVAVAGTGGSVVATSVTGGACTGTACTLDAGASTVTFTPTAGANHAFVGWAGCTGYTQAGSSITFTNPTSAKTCTANFGATVVVTATAGTGGTVAASSVTGGSCVGTNCTLDSGASTVTFTPTPSANYRFGSWSGCTGYTQSGNAITFTNPTAAKSCVASFTAVVAVSATAGTGGTVAASNITGGSCTGTNCTLDSGASSVTFTATASTNYRFAGWSGCSASTNAGISITNATSNQTCTANFVATLTVAATAGTGGTVAASNVSGGTCSGTTCTLDSGASTVTFTPTASANYRFGSWSGASCTGYTQSGSSITFTNPASAKACTASFVATVAISATAGTGGTVAASAVTGGTCTGTGCTLDSGASTVTFTPTANANYRFDTWSGCIGYTQSGNSITFTNQTVARSCTANFVAVINVSATAGTGGSVAAFGVSGGTCSGTSCSLDSGASTVTFTPTASANYRFGSWSGASCTGYTTSGNSITFTNPTSAKTCTANFVATVDVSASTGGGGTIAASGVTGGSCSGTNCTLDSGASTVTFTPSASSGYRFGSWSNCTGYSTSGSSITFTNPTAAKACLANFIVTVNVSATAGTGGTVAASNVTGGSCSGTSCTLDSGASSVTFTPSATAGYTFSGWSGATCTGYSQTGNAIAFSNPTAAKACTANFVATITVSAAAGTGGSVTASGVTGGSCSGTSCTLVSGASTVTFTPSASSNYRFVNWTGATCTGYSQSGNAITFSNPTAAKACTANFAATVVVTGSAGTGGSVSVSAFSGGSCSGTTCTLDSGNSSVTFLATPSANYRFGSWSGCSTSTNASVTLSNPTVSTTCTATFVATVPIDAVPTPAAGGSISVTNLSNGTCSGSSCALDSGNSTVQFTPVAAANFRFTGWSGNECFGYSQGSGNSIIFSNPTSARSCIANFIEQVTVEATIVGNGSVALSNVQSGTCSGLGCVFDSGTGSVSFTPTAQQGYRFAGWSGPTCTGYNSLGNRITFNNPTSSHKCIANFEPAVTIAVTDIVGLGSVNVTFVSNGTCDGATFPACILSSGAGTVTFTPTPQQGWHFQKWFNCDGYSLNQQTFAITFTNPTTDKACVAAFSQQ